MSFYFLHDISPNNIIFQLLVFNIFTARSKLISYNTRQQIITRWDIFFLCQQNNKTNRQKS